MMKGVSAVSLSLGSLLLLCLVSGSVARPPPPLTPSEERPPPPTPLPDDDRTASRRTRSEEQTLEQWLEASGLSDDSRKHLMDILRLEELTSVRLVLDLFDVLKTRKFYENLPMGSAAIFEDYVYWTRNVDTQDQSRGEVGGRTALMMAAESGQTDVVRFLLEKGANVNLRDNAQKTALMLATDGGHTDIVRSLLENGAQVDMKGRMNNQPVAVQYYKRGWGTISWARGQEKGTALMFAAHKGHSEIVSALLEKWANVDLQSDPNGWTALMLAAEGGHTEVVGALLMHGEHGAKVDLQTTDGGTALLWAVRAVREAGKTDVVKALVKNERIGKDEIDKALQELGVGQSSASAARSSGWSQALEDVLKYRRMFLENRE